MGISSTFQEVVVARLRDQMPGVLVAETVDASAVKPYITIGPSDFVPEDTDCTDAREEALQIDIWASSHPTKRVAKDTTDEVAAALKGWVDNTVLTMHPIEVTRARVIDDIDPMIAHGIVQIEAFIEDQ